MSLILKDPMKYKEMKDLFQKKDEATLKNTLDFIKGSSDKDTTEFLDFLGRFLHHVRMNNNMSLRSFCKKHNLDATIVSEVERGLRLPNIDLMDIYLIDGKDNNEPTQVEISTRED